MSSLIKSANSLMTILCCLSLLSSSTSRLVKASDQTRIRKLCIQTREPEECQRCLQSDHTEATHGHENADMLAKNSTLKLRQALNSCSAILFDAANLLYDGLTLMESKKYQDAYHEVKRSTTDLLSCEDAFRKVAKAPIPYVLQQNLTPMTRLSDVASDFFHRLNVTS